MAEPRTADMVARSITYHGEGPFWDVDEHRILLMDLLAGAIVVVDGDGNHDRLSVPTSTVSLIRRRKSGGFVVAGDDCVMLSDREFTIFEPLVTLTTRAGLRTNDGGCDPTGGFVVGVMAANETPHLGSVMRVTAAGDATDLVRHTSIPNGVQWSVDGTKTFFIDTPTRGIDVFDVDPESGIWRNRRNHIDLSDADGFPDGMAIDANGGLWVAMWGGGCVRHYDQQGRLAEIITVPGVSQVSCCCFGGEALDVLYISTSRQGLLNDTEPDAGSLYAISTGIRGAQLFEFFG